MRLRCLLTSLLAVIISVPAKAVPSLVERVRDGVYVVRDDSGQWGGNMSNSITHQNRANYQAKKVLDLSDVPAEVWAQTKAVRLSAYFMVRDYSWHDRPPANGLDEAFEIVVNGETHRYPTNCGAPVFAEGGPPTIAWYDFALPKEEFTRGVNEIILRKAPSEKNDDYLYLGIDNSVKRGNSFVTFDGKTWRQDALTVPGGSGEYMARLYLLTKETRARVAWQPGRKSRLDDAAKFIAYVGSRQGEVTNEGLRLTAGESARMEWSPLALDSLEPVKATIESSGNMQFAWLDDKGKPVQTVKGISSLTQTLPANRTWKPSGLIVTALESPVTLKRVAVEAAMSYHPQPKMIDMRPEISEPKGQVVRRSPTRRIDGERIILENSDLRCQFTAENGHLQLTSLYNRYTACEMVTDASKVDLFLIEANGKRYAGSREFRCNSVKSIKNGFIAELLLAEPTLKATLTVSIDNEGLRLGLNLTNAGQKPVDFKLAFPHLAGLTASGKPAEDYYFFPWGGGIIADVPAILRRGYGDHEAIYQVMDVFSPSRGGGLYVRADDAEGWHKTLALRKYVPGAMEENAERTYLETAEEYKWTNPLEAVAGIGFTYEYLRRTRELGESFAPASAVLAAHPGDWHAAMKAYADWAHKVWKFRPYPSRLKDVHNMIATGWGQDILFRDGKYRTDFIRPMTDCIELMSWWDWSPLGPWRTPIDKVKEVLGEATYRTWLPYFVKDPVTGQMMWNNQPGDYDGYNERFGGLPAFRQAIQTYKNMGALVTLYTDPIRCDDNTKTGQRYGKQWGVVKSNGEHVKSYDVWNMCHDVAEYRQWVADTMKRVMRETGADGVRLDEYGHKGWACFSKLHQHSFAEPGVSQWQKAIAETCRLVRQAMDEVAPGSVLTTEHPGYDYEMQFLEGCITYDLTVQASPLRPLECNLQRFYFPECKAYELDHRGADLQSRKKLWNGVASFGRYYPVNMYHIWQENSDVFASRDCEPLIPTLAQYVYANRFAHGEKTIYTVYNATGHTFDGAALALTLKPGEHIFDLLNNRSCEIERRGNAAHIRLYLERDDVACLVRLPRRLSVVKQGDVIEVNVKPPAKDCRLVVCNAVGDELLSQPAKEGKDRLDLSKLPGDAKLECVKLVRGGQLLDVAVLP